MIRRNNPEYMKARYPRCEEYYAGCVQCQAWRMFDATGKVPYLKAVYKECDRALGNAPMWEWFKPE